MLLMARSYDEPYTEAELRTVKQVALRSPWNPFTGTMNVMVSRNLLPAFLTDWHSHPDLASEYSLDIHIEPNWTAPTTPIASFESRCHMRQSCRPLLDWMGRYGDIFWVPQESHRPFETTEIYIWPDGKVRKVELYNSDGA